MKMFVSHTITVPIYKNDVLYGKEIDKKEYKVKLSAPDIYDLYTISDDYGVDYLNINSSKSNEKLLVTGVDGSSYYIKYYYLDKYAVRPVAFLKKDTKIVNGLGTINKPYVVK